MLQKIDGVPFQIQKPFDFSFLKEYGRVFCVLDSQDSGNICFGTELNGSRYFIKFAGAQPVRYSGDPADTVQRLQSASAVWHSCGMRIWCSTFPLLPPVAGSAWFFSGRTACAWAGSIRLRTGGLWLCPCRKGRRRLQIYWLLCSMRPPKIM